MAWMENSRCLSGILKSDHGALSRLNTRHQELEVGVFHNVSDPVSVGQDDKSAFHRADSVLQ